MKKRPLVHLGRAAAICALFATTAAHAQAPPVLTPPRLVQASPGETSRDPRPAGPQPRVTVEIELEIDAQGRVTSARLVTASDEPARELEEAAILAANRFVFEPATRDGVPVPARIRYAYVFPAREAAPEAVDAKVSLSALAGVALDAEKNLPIANADVVLTTNTGGAMRTKTDASGAFRFDGLGPGPVHVVVTSEGYLPTRLDETLEEGTLTEAKLRLARTPDPEAFEARARVDAPPREVTKRTLSREEMTRMPGTRGDPIRATELLPGVGRAPAGGGNPILRGANLIDSQVFAEGAPVPILYHFGGLSSFAHGRVLDTVDVYPSNFGVRYGRKSGGVIDVRFRDPRTDALHGIVDVSLLESSLLVETPVGEKVSFLGAARRSNLDAVLNSAVKDDNFAIQSAPVYWDYQAIAAYRPTERDRIRLVSFGSRDSFKALQKTPIDADPSLRGQLVQTVAFHDLQLGWRHRFDGGSEALTEVTYGRTDTREGFGSTGQSRFAIDTIQGRSELALVLSPAVRLVTGLDVLANHFSGSYAGVPQPEGEGAATLALATQRKVSVSASTWVLQPAAYAEVGVRPTKRWLVTPGIRADYNDFVDEGSLDPRVSSRWEVTDETALKAGIGRFSQHPEESRIVRPIGNPNLGFIHSTHLSAGVEQKLGDAVTVSGEGFAKWIDGIVASTPNRVEPFYFNSQSGRVFGGELFARYKPTGRFFGFVSYTLMRSERRDFGGAWRLFDRDTPHLVSAAGVYRLGRGWEVGAALRVTSGTPYTPVASSTYDATSDVYVPRNGAPMSARNPAYVRLDARVEKKWTFQAGRSVAVYLDVQNVLNAPNREGFSYGYDYSRREGVRGLPIFPALGVRGEL